MRAAATSASASGIRFTSDQGIILTGPDSLYRLAAEVLAVNGHRRLDEALPGLIRPESTSRAAAVTRNHVDDHGVAGPGVRAC